MRLVSHHIITIALAIICASCTVKPYVIDPPESQGFLTDEERWYLKQAIPLTEELTQISRQVASSFRVIDTLSKEQCVNDFNTYIEDLISLRHQYSGLQVPSRFEELHILAIKSQIEYERGVQSALLSCMAHTRSERDTYLSQAIYAFIQAKSRSEELMKKAEVLSSQIKGQQ